MAVASAENTAAVQAWAPGSSRSGWSARGIWSGRWPSSCSRFPFDWMVATSLKTQAEALASPPIWVFTPNLDNYYSVLFNRDVLSSLINSIIIAVSTTVLAVVGTLAAQFGPSSSPRKSCGSGSSPTAC